MPIFDKADPFNSAAVAALEELTIATRDTHSVHRMTSSWGPGSFFDITPNEDVPEVAHASFYIDPATPPKDGDILVEYTGGRERRSFIFDVKAYGHPADLFSANMVIANPDAGIGHARKDSEGFSAQSALQSSGGTPGRSVSTGSSAKEVGSAFTGATTSTQSRGTTSGPMIFLDGPKP